MNRMSSIKQKQAKEAAALRADIAKLKADMAHSRTEDKAKIKAKLDELHKELRATLAHAKRSSEKREEDTRARLHSLQEKAANASGEARARLEAQIADIRKESAKVHADVGRESQKVRSKLKRS